jgi:hypothetical protein
MHRYELQAHNLTRQGKRYKNRKPAFTIASSDPHEIATHMWRIRKESPFYDLQVLDREVGRAHLAPVVSYEELLRRAGSLIPGRVGL